MNPTAAGMNRGEGEGGGSEPGPSFNVKRALNEGSRQKALSRRASAVVRRERNARGMPSPSPSPSRIEPFDISRIENPVLRLDFERPSPVVRYRARIPRISRISRISRNLSRRTIVRENADTSVTNTCARCPSPRKRTTRNDRVAYDRTYRKFTRDVRRETGDER